MATRRSASSNRFFEPFRVGLERLDNMNKTAEYTEQVEKALNDAVESGRYRTTDDWKPRNDRTSESQTDPDDWEPK